ncbi:hypothetical protein MLD38_015410 [Melastoma candidum]|uniref:Uncharacterized protein n=1 Tax=Melastoma candidum TaxID=119954 RepID=A0ACB9RK72_9MYRT|nr:hypothetical protein MLD38_015410 [Melastoma candidum]
MVKGRQGERVRLYVRGTILGYKRSKSNQYPNTSLIQIEGVNTKEEVSWYAGKRMAYIYKAKVKKNGSHYRCIWGKVTRPHGNSGVVRAKFKSNLPPKSMGNRSKQRLTLMPKKGYASASQGGAVAKEKKLSSTTKKKPNDEIDVIFASKKVAKGDRDETNPDKRGDALSVKPKEMKKKKKNDRKGKGGDKLNSMDTKWGSQPRKKTGDGLAIYTQDELGINKGDAGDLSVYFRFVKEFAVSLFETHFGVL